MIYGMFFSMSPQSYSCLVLLLSSAERAQSQKKAERPTLGQWQILWRRIGAWEQWLKTQVIPIEGFRKDAVGDLPYPNSDDTKSATYEYVRPFAVACAAPSARIRTSSTHTSATT